MTSTKTPIGGVRKEVDPQKLDPALLIASSRVLACGLLDSDHAQQWGS